MIVLKEPGFQSRCKPKHIDKVAHQAYQDHPFIITSGCRHKAYECRISINRNTDIRIQVIVLQTGKQDEQSPKNNIQYFHVNDSLLRTLPGGGAGAAKKQRDTPLFFVIIKVV